MPHRAVAAPGSTVTVMNSSSAFVSGDARREVHHLMLRSRPEICVAIAENGRLATSFRCLAALFQQGVIHALSWRGRQGSILDDAAGKLDGLKRSENAREKHAWLGGGLNGRRQKRSKETHRSDQSHFHHGFPSGQPAPRVLLRATRLYLAAYQLACSKRIVWSCFLVKSRHLIARRERIVAHQL